MKGRDLIAAARGRTLCLSLLCARSEPLARSLQQLERDLERQTGSDYPRVGTLHPTAEQLTRLADAITAVDVASLAAETDSLRLLVGLGDAVDSAMPWQPPFIRDALTAFPTTRDALLPAAKAIATAPGARWWNEPIDLAHEYETWGAPPGRPAALAGQALRHEQDRVEAVEVAAAAHEPSALPAAGEGEHEREPSARGGLWHVQRCGALPPVDLEGLRRVARRRCARRARRGLIRGRRRPARCARPATGQYCDHGGSDECGDEA